MDSSVLWVCSCSSLTSAIPPHQLIITQFIFKEIHQKTPLHHIFVNFMFFCFFFQNFIHSFARNLDHLTWVRLQQLQEQCYTFLTACAVFLCVQTKVWLPMLGSFNHLMCIWTGAVQTIGESALKLDFGKKKKILCWSGESNLPQWGVSLMLYQLSYILLKLISIH